MREFNERYLGKHYDHALVIDGRRWSGSWRGPDTGRRNRELARRRASSDGLQPEAWPSVHRFESSWPIVEMSHALRALARRT